MRRRNRTTSVRHSHAAAATWLSSRPSNVSASPVHHQPFCGHPGHMGRDPARLGSDPPRNACACGAEATCADRHPRCRPAEPSQSRIARRCASRSASSGFTFCQSMKLFALAMLASRLAISCAASSAPALRRGSRGGDRKSDHAGPHNDPGFAPAQSKPLHHSFNPSISHTGRRHRSFIRHRRRDARLTAARPSGQARYRRTGRFTVNLPRRSRRRNAPVRLFPNGYVWVTKDLVG